jgi:hypothetical protein
MKMKLLVLICVFGLCLPTVIANKVEVDSSHNLRYGEVYESALNKSEWKIKAKDLHFEEDTIARSNRKPKEFKSRTSFNFTPFKYFFLLLAIALIVWVLYLIIKNFKNKNIVNKSPFLYRYEAPEKEELMQLHINELFNDAVAKKDFALAYRLKYLNALKLLVLKNVILYKKYNTNYELMLQIKPKEIQSMFKKLTFNFDGIWYGEMLLTEESFNELMIVFSQFESLIASHK